MQQHTHTLADQPPPAPLGSAPAQPLPSQQNTCPGPFCHRVLLTLETKGAHYDSAYIDFNDKPQW